MAHLIEFAVQMGSIVSHATAQMNHTLAHLAAFHQHSIGAPLSSPLLERCPEFTRERCKVPLWATPGPFKRCSLPQQVNFLGHFLLTSLLVDSLKAGGPSRVVNLSSVMHRAHLKATDFTKYKPRADGSLSGEGVSSSYSDSKLAMVRKAYSAT